MARKAMQMPEFQEAFQTHARTHGSSIHVETSLFGFYQFDEHAPNGGRMTTDSFDAIVVGARCAGSPTVQELCGPDRRVERNPSRAATRWKRRDLRSPKRRCPERNRCSHPMASDSSCGCSNAAEEGQGCCCKLRSSNETSAEAVHRSAGSRTIDRLNIAVASTRESFGCLLRSRRPLSGHCRPTWPTDDPLGQLTYRVLAKFCE
jgi:hypothetical protein